MPNLYNPTADIWPDLARGVNVLAPVRVGRDRRTGKMIVGWDHVLQSMEVMFATRYHERILRRWVGSFVPHILGENLNERTITRFYWAIASAIDLWEPCYSIQRVLLATRDDGSQLTSVEEVRKGQITIQMEGVYMPRGHLGDKTPERRRGIGLVGRGGGVWNARGIDL